MNRSKKKYTALLVILSFVLICAFPGYALNTSEKKSLSSSADVKKQTYDKKVQSEDVDQNDEGNSLSNFESEDDDATAEVQGDEEKQDMMEMRWNCWRRLISSGGKAISKRRWIRLMRRIP